MGTGYRRSYVKANWKHTFVRWDTGSTVIALALVLIAAGGWIGSWVGLWAISDQWAGILSGGATVVLLAWLIWLFVVQTPAEMWRAAQPLPFAPVFESVVLEQSHEIHRWLVRINVVNNGAPVLCEAHVTDTDGRKTWSSLPLLAWANRQEPAIRLGKEPEQITLASIYEVPETESHAKIMRPGIPMTEYAGPVFPSSATPDRLWFKIEVRNLDTQQSDSIGIVVSDLGLGGMAKVAFGDRQ